MHISTASQPLTYYRRHPLQFWFFVILALGSIAIRLIWLKQQAFTSPTLLKAISPKAAVISVGIDNKFGHPHEYVLGRLSPLPIFRTDEQA